MDLNLLNLLWLVFNAGLVFLMQAGFLVLETGLTRSKNNINVGLKNIVDFGISTLIFWAFGYAFMFGLSRNGLIGTTNFIFSPGADFIEPAFFVFQAMFCGTAVTILSGALAERMRFTGYMVVTIVVSALIYPIFGHWAWNGLLFEQANGWLRQLGFIDFAGSTVVHSIGGWCSLALCLIVGPRYGRFPKDSPPQKIQGSNIPLATLGVMLLWVGWLGFNGGSTLELSTKVPSILLNTLLGGTAGLITAMTISQLTHKRVTIEFIFNGSLSGLVAITANAHVVNAVQAVLIGCIGSICMIIITRLLEHYRIDDAIGAIPVHLGAGIWGTLAVGIFGSLDTLGTALSRSQQIGVQLLGIGTAFLWAFGLAYILFFLINKIFPLRVSVKAEMEGLNVSEHGASTALLDLYNTMERQSKLGDLSARAPVEPFTEVGQIAQNYNEVMASLENVVTRNNIIIQEAHEGIVLVSGVDWTIQSLNPAGCAMFGISQETDMAHTPVYDHLVGIDQYNIQATLDHLIKDGSFIEGIGIHADGSRFPMEMTITKIETNGETLYNGIFRNISQRLAIQEALAEARDKAVEANQLKGQFLATISHELRTPLNAILGLAEMIELGLYGDVTEKQQFALKQIMDSTGTLESLVNELLDQAHLESGELKIEQEPVNLSTLLEHVHFTLGVLATAKGLELKTSLDDALPKVIMGDEKRLIQILTNLIGNSIKFTNQGFINVALRLHQENAWMIIVSDSGIGISDVAKENVFEAFKQTADVITRDQGGVGLGLSIVKKLITLMNGDIRLDSVVGQGTEFTITLPLVKIGEQNEEST